MIKKIIGILFAVGVLALIALTALDAGSYRSMLPDSFFSAIGLAPSQQEANQEVEQAVEQATEQPSTPTDAATEQQPQTPNEN